MWEALAACGAIRYPLAEGEDAGAAEHRLYDVALMAEADVVMTAITGTDPWLPAFRFVADYLGHHSDAHAPRSPQTQQRILPDGMTSWDTVLSQSGQ